MVLLLTFATLEVMVLMLVVGARVNAALLLNPDNILLTGVYNTTWFITADAVLHRFLILEVRDA